MRMNIILCLFILISSSQTCDEFKNYSYKSINESFNCLNSVSTTISENKILVDLLHTYFEAYVYKDILKAPPQPSFSRTYYKSVDIDTELKNININTSCLYDFLVDIQKIIISTGDSHLNFFIRPEQGKPNALFFDFYYSLPFKVSISNTKQMYLLPQSLTDPFNESIPISIVRNQDIVVKYINGKDPFYVIRRFADLFVPLKCPHARFTNAQKSFTFGSIGRTPLPKSYLNTKFEIEWENGEKDVISYFILRINRSSMSKRARKKVDGLYTSGIGNILLPEDVFDSLSRGYNKLKKNEDLGYVSNDKMVSCSVNTTKKINTFVLTSFAPDDDWQNYQLVIKQCINLFDENSYPIQIILPLNGGGYVTYAQNIEKIFAPHDDVNLIVSARISNFTEKVMKQVEAKSIKNPPNCQPREKTNVDVLGDWYMNPRIINYGNNEHKIIQPSLIDENGEIIERFINNQRKPTDIVVYTDSFCFSGCSIFTKGLKERGSAIITGFGGDPNGNIDEFEVGQSPTTVLFLNEYLGKSSDPFIGYGYGLSLSFFETFRFNYNYNETIPREFLPDIVDERVDIFSFSSNDYSAFIESTLTIIEKYKTRCNPKNKRLVKKTTNCDSKIKIPHAHGGYECDDNGFWSTKCVPTYCDYGYLFDFDTKRCILQSCPIVQPDGFHDIIDPEDPSSQETSTSETTSSGINNVFIHKTHFMIIVLIIFVL
ncbi:hypothetical protein ENU1_077820 [Entamoeba nuttalli P19]|uniref:Uncharacterized protein n=1 Tax=Entamoeba nuttalli (strain P19) TaxID=1076696 RepID=K2HX09_ENTNP|nr:hypothetical protein ENU1_077820 [Entamoeba nuttalli P19]EKE40850.1 hypothetical protein ENU1_077820 [Entamoeba nuttalli P19]|eukprot:XP_008856820.1 hypothetical protein ENU1_077820 [Entamoeba nuttalli P19]